MLRTNSLAFRLSAIAAVWSLLGLLAGSLGLSTLFRNSAERNFDTRLMSDLEGVIAVAELDCDGTVTMPRPLVAERFMNPFSGFYWQIANVEGANAAKPKATMR